MRMPPLPDGGAAEAGEAAGRAAARASAVPPVE
jgi:hypothetical protein